MDVTRLMDEIAILHGSQPKQVGDQRTQIGPTTGSGHHRALNPFREGLFDVFEKPLDAPEPARRAVGQSDFHWFHKKCVEAEWRAEVRVGLSNADILTR